MESPPLSFWYTLSAAENEDEFLPHKKGGKKEREVRNDRTDYEQLQIKDARYINNGQADN